LFAGMTAFQHVLALLLIVTAASVAGRWLPWPRPITYLLAGLGSAFVPYFPRVELDPEIFFLCFLPPLLFYDGWMMPLREFARAKGQILLLATGLVAFTTLGVGWVAHLLVPGLPLAMAFALGAIVSPTDAVAVSAITQRLKVPTRLRIILEGESLLNDATGLVAFKFALAAMMVGSFSVPAMAGNFLLLAVGGLALGLVVAWLIGRLRDALRRREYSDPLTEATLSLLTPFAAYLPADALDLSGVMAVAAAGLYSGWRDPVRTDGDARQTTSNMWTVLVFWLNGLAFVLLGLQLPAVFAAVRGSFSLLELAGFSAAVAGATMALRVIWVFPGTFIPYLLSRRIRLVDERPSWRAVFVGGWAGMRGAVTLAAAMSIPLLQPDGSPFPARDLVIFLASAVVVATLLVQGTSMEALIRWLGLREDPARRREDRLARTTAVEAGLKTLREAEQATPGREESAALGHVVAEYEQRLSELAAEGETRTNAQTRRAAERAFRCQALRAERDAIDQLWREDVISDEVHRPLQQLLDHEEALLLGRQTPVDEA
jgi:monovalent cation/hydrogen antiporter